MVCTLGSLLILFLFLPSVWSDSYLGESHPIQLHVDDQQFQLLPRGDGRSIEIVDVLSRSQRQTQMVTIRFNSLALWNFTQNKNKNENEKNKKKTELRMDENTQEEKEKKKEKKRLKEKKEKRG